MKPGMHKDPAARLKKLGIRSFCVLIHDQPKEWLLENFHEGATDYPVNVSAIMKNIIWQTRQRILSGDKPPLKELVRTFWYMYIKPTLARVEALTHETDQYRQLVDTLVLLVKDAVLMDYKDIGVVGLGQKNADVSCTTDIYGGLITGPITGTSTGYGGVAPPVIYKNTDPFFIPNCKYPAITTPVLGRVLEFEGPNLVKNDCRMVINCVPPGQPSCRLSVIPAGSDSAICDPSNDFMIRVTYSNVKGDDKLVVDGTLAAIPPPPDGKYLLTKTNLQNCGDGLMYCDGPFTYDSPGNYQITGCIIKSGWGANSAKTCANVGDPDVILCNPQTDVTCTVPGAVPCENYI